MDTEIVSFITTTGNERDSVLKKFVADHRLLQEGIKKIFNAKKEILFEFDELGITQLEYFYRKHYYETESPQNEREEFYKILKEWITIATDPAKKAFFVTIKQDQEEQVKNIILDENGKDVHKFFSAKPAGKEIINDLIISWFLPRYDLTTVKRLIKYLPKESVKGTIKKTRKKISRFYSIDKKKNGWYYSFLILIPFLIILSLLTGYFTTGNNILQSFFPITLRNITIETINSTEIIPICYNPLQLSLEIFLAVIIFVLSIKLLFKQNYIYLYLPRLIVGIVIGYLLIISGEVFWETGIWGDTIVLVIICIFSVSSCYFYLRYEIMKSIEKASSEMNKRVMRILSRGIIYSFAIGFLVLDIFHKFYISLFYGKSLENIPLRFNCGILGVVDPYLLLFFAPLALFIGLVIQFIWEERPVTHPVK